MITAYQAPSKSIYGSGGYMYAGQPQVVQPQVVQQASYPTILQPQPQVARPMSVIGGGMGAQPMVMAGQMGAQPMAMAGRMGAQPMAMAGGQEDEFPFMAMRVTGGFQIALGIILIAVGIAAVEMDPQKVTGLLGIFAMISILITGIMSIAIGTIGLLHSKLQGKIETFRNTYMVMGAMMAVYCMFVFAVALYIFLLVAQPLMSVGAGAVMNIYGTLFIVLIVVTFLEGVMAMIGSSISCCCAPSCCSPLVDQNEYSYVYRKEVSSPYMPMGYPTARPQVQMY